MKSSSTPFYIRWLHRLMNSCKETTLLSLKAQDRPLTGMEQWRKSWHLWLCTGCRRFDAQLLTMRNSLSAWRNYEESKDDKP